jgi:hypothetical protein
MIAGRVPALARHRQAKSQQSRHEFLSERLLSVVVIAFD